MNGPESHFHPFHSYRSFGTTVTPQSSDHPTTPRGRTILHKRFRDLLALNSSPLGVCTAAVDTAVAAGAAAD